MALSIEIGQIHLPALRLLARRGKNSRGREKVRKSEGEPDVRINSSDKSTRSIRARAPASDPAI